jgi:hypothetical protein
MSNSTSIYTFKCELNIPDVIGKLKLEALEITYGVGKLGQIEAQGHPDKGQAIIVEPAPVAEYYDIAGKIQKYVNTVRRTTTDCTLQLTATSTTGTSETISLQMLLAGASVSISASGSLSLSISMLAEDALMSGWSPSILFFSDHHINGTGDGTTAQITGVGVGDIAAKCIEVLETDMTRALSSDLGTKDPGREASVKEYQELRDYATLVKEFLKKNANNTVLQGYASWPDPAKTSLIDAMVELVKGGKDGLGMMLAENGFSYLFGVNFVSNLSSKAAETSVLVRASDVFDASPESIDIDILTGSIRINASDVVPLKGVKCELPAGLVQGDGQTKGSPLTSFRYFPTSAANEQSPRIATVNPPEYLVRMTVPGSKKSDPPDATVPDPETGKEGSKDMLKDTNEKIKNLSDLIDDWLKVHYIMLSLQGSTGSVATPLNLKWEAGKRYTVKGPDQKPLFTGLLQTVTHSINVRPENGSAITNLNFAFVTGNGYELQLD